MVPLGATNPPNRLGSGYTINYVPPSATFTGACLRGCHYRTSDLEFVVQFTEAAAVELDDFALSSVLAATAVLTPASGVATEWRLQVQVTSVPAAGAVFDVGFDMFGYAWLLPSWRTSDRREALTTRSSIRCSVWCCDLDAGSSTLWLDQASSLQRSSRCHTCHRYQHLPAPLGPPTTSPSSPRSAAQSQASLPPSSTSSPRALVVGSLAVTLRRPGAGR